jgi:hypothetical protein
MMVRAPAPEELVGLLSDRARRRVVAALDEAPAAIGEIVARVGGTSPKDVVEAVERLVHAGVVEEQGDGRLQLVDDVFQRSVREAAAERVGDLNDEQTRIFRRYFFRNRLLQIPSEPWALDAVLRLIAEDFQPGQEYGEREVNATLYGWHGDWAALRRLLVDHGHVTRQAGVYRRA